MRGGDADGRVRKLDYDDDGESESCRGMSVPAVPEVAGPSTMLWNLAKVQNRNRKSFLSLPTLFTLDLLLSFMYVIQTFGQKTKFSKSIDWYD